MVYSIGSPPLNNLAKDILLHYIFAYCSFSRYDENDYWLIFRETQAQS